MDESERRCLASIEESLDQHRDACPMTPRAVYIAGEVYERFGWTNQAVCGVPVRPEDERPVQRDARAGDEDLVDAVGFVLSHLRSRFLSSFEFVAVRPLDAGALAGTCGARLDRWGQR